MAKFHSLAITDIRQETSECVSIAFDVPENLKKEYTYKQGQYLTFKLKIDGEEIRRSYSLCSSPVADKELRVAVKRVKNGKGSNFLNDKIRPGDTLEVMTPAGTFFSEIKSSNKKNYVLFAGGSGITPMYSIIKTVLQAEPESTLQLFYGNQNEASIIFKQELEKIADENKNRLQLFHVLDKPSASGHPELLTGILSEEKINTLLDKYAKSSDNNEYFICGPGPMMDNAKNVLTSRKADPKTIHIEYFSAASAGNDSKKTLPEISSAVTVIIDGIETHFELASTGKSILDAAIDNDADAPFACKGAVCCTCKAKLIEGKVSMDMNYALSEEEVKEGFILTCQSHPITEKVTVDYDVI